MKPTPEKTLSNTYFILAIMMELCNQTIEEFLAKKTIELKQLHGFRFEHKQNHARMMQGVKLIQNSVEKLGLEYSEHLPIDQFDMIREDANYMLRCLLRVINASPDTKEQGNIESMLRGMDKQGIFSEKLIESYKLK